MEVGLGAFVKFANASPRARPRLARVIAEQANSAYNPVTDFWRPVRQAIKRDRKTSRDGEALRALVQSTRDRRRPSFDEVGERWADVAPRWSLSTHAASSTAHIEVGGVQVRAAPLFTEQLGDGLAEAAHVWFNKEELQPDTVEAVRHLLGRESYGRYANPVFIDMRRAFAVPAVAQPDSTVEEWLEVLGRELARLAS